MDYAAARTAMVDCQVRPSDVTRFPIIDAMLWAPREIFVPRSRRSAAYAGNDIQISDDRYLLDPRVFSKMLDAAQFTSDDFVLDIAGATGYSAAIISKLCSTVLAMEQTKEMVDAASNNLSELNCNNVATLEGDISEGSAKHGPYNVIFINGSVEEISDTLLNQLAEGGRLVTIKAAGPVSQCVVVTRKGNSFTTRRAFDATAPDLKEFNAAPEFAF